MVRQHIPASCPNFSNDRYWTPEVRAFQSDCPLQQLIVALPIFALTLPSWISV